MQLADMVGRALIYQRKRFKFEPRLDVRHLYLDNTSILYVYSIPFLKDIIFPVSDKKLVF